MTTLHKLGLEAGAQQLQHIVTDGVAAIRPHLRKAGTTLKDMAAEVTDQFTHSARAAAKEAGGTQGNRVNRLITRLVSLPGRIVEQARLWIVRLTPDNLVEGRIGSLTGGINKIYADAARQALGPDELATYNKLRQQVIEKLKTGPQPELLKGGGEFQELGKRVQAFIDDSPKLRGQAYRLGDELSRIVRTKPQLLEKVEHQQALASLV